jgi:hypothetical protein
MTIKKREVIALYDFLNDMQSGDVTLSIQDWKTLTENKSVMESELSKIDKARIELVREHSSLPEDSELIKVDDDKRQIFGKKYIEILEEEIDIDLQSINVSNLGETMNGKNGIWEFMKYMVSK